MPTNIAMFEAQLVAEQKSFDQEAIEFRKLQILTFVEFAGELIPYRTGHAHANIIVTVGFIDQDEIEEDGLTTGELIARAAAELENLKLDDEVYVQSNAPYSSYLNDGSPTTAATGFWDNAAAATNARLP